MNLTKKPLTKKPLTKKPLAKKQTSYNNPHQAHLTFSSSYPTKKPLPPLKIMNYVCIVLTSGGTVALSPLLFWIKKGLTI